MDWRIIANIANRNTYTHLTATHVCKLQHGSNMLILICAWRDNEVDSDDSRRTPNYWATRLQPLIGQPVTALV